MKPQITNFQLPMSDAQTPRQDKLIEDRLRQVERGTLKTCHPVPPLVLPDPRNCPVCGKRMNWYPARKAFICDVIH